MSFQDFMSKVRYLDNQMSKWMVRHFYMLFFEALLVVLFVVIFIITIKVIDVSVAISPAIVNSRLALLQTVNLIIIVFLLLLNSFWMLYMFNGIIRIQNILKEISFNLLNILKRKS